MTTTKLPSTDHKLTFSQPSPHHVVTRSFLMEPAFADVGHLPWPGVVLFLHLVEMRVFAEKYSLSTPEGGRIEVIPCPCGECDGTTLLVEQRKGKKRRKVEIRLSAASLELLQNFLERAQEFHDRKIDESPWSPDLN